MNNQVLSEADSFKQEQSNINKLEKQAEDFLNVVFYRKGKKLLHTLKNVLHVTLILLKGLYDVIYDMLFRIFGMLQLVHAYIRQVKLK